MPSLHPRRRVNDPSAPRSNTHRCRQRGCAADLSLVRRRVTPARLAPSITLEFYVCDRCDSGFALTVDTGTWKRWEPDLD
jgi:hypothetical protein